jgi:hypothetical protein
MFIIQNNFKINYRKSSLKMTWYITGLLNGKSLRRYHWNFADCIHDILV